MKKYLLLIITILLGTLVRAQDDMTLNPNNKAYYSRYYDAPPRFPDMYIGGMYQYFTDHTQYPKNIAASISGQINIHAIVDTTGAIVDPLVIRSISPEVDQEVLKVLANAPHLQPAIYKGHKVPVFLAVVMDISVDADNKTIKVTRDLPAQLKEMQWAKKIYDVKPRFTADHSNLYKYIADSIKYPVTAPADVNGIVQLHFIVDTTGSVKNITVIKTVSKEADQAIIDALNQAPRFTPGMLGAKKVTVGFTFSMEVNINTTLKTIVAKQLPPPPPPGNNTVSGQHHEVVSDNSVKNPNQIYTAVEVNPGYPGGESAFTKYLQQNIHYPPYAKKNKVQGTVYIQFVVETDGSLADIKAVRTPSSDLAEEAIRVMKHCDKWTPGYQNNTPVRVQFTVPVNFSL